MPKAPAHATAAREVRSRQPAAHPGLADRNIQAQPVKQIHGRADRVAWRRGGVAAAGRHARERLEHDAVRGIDGELGVVVGGRDLDDVDAGDVVLVAELTHHAQQVGAGDAARLGVPVPGACAGSSTSMSTDT